MSGHEAPPPPPTFKDKAAVYDWLVKQVEYLVDGMSSRLTPQANLVIGLGNTAALCFYELNRFAAPGAALQALPVNWFGFYLLQGPGLLALGPFQGRPACTEIKVGKGVCGVAAERAEVLVVPDVHAFPGHIACDSASDSEVVVPILSENGSVLGVIDMDSTVVGHFDEEDGKGLAAVARVLARHLEFPMARAIAVNPALGMPSFSVAVGGAAPPPPTDPQPDPALPTLPPTAVTTAIPHFTIEAARPDTATKIVGNWEITTTRLDRIMNQTELQELEKQLGIAAFPEIQFSFNTLTLVYTRSDGTKVPALAFNAVALLADAAHFYTTPYFKETVDPQLTIPVSEWWANNGYDRHDPHVDWAWRHRYFGVPHAQLADRLQPRQPDAPGINWDLLKDCTLPIIFFDSFDFFEDDLHDHGMVSTSAKLRVMESAFFVLLRQAVRVDGHALWLRDVRFYHEFAWAQPTRIAVEEQTRLLSLANSNGASTAGGHAPADWRNLSLDQLAQQAQVLSTNEFTLTV